MPFGLKNAGATYQRMMQNCLIWQIGRNVEVYVDDIVDEGSSLLADLAKTFQSLRSYSIKLNPAKCVFGVPAGKLLGFMVSERGIEANPEKIAAIQNMNPPQQLRDVQKLTGCLAALSRFISILGEKALPLYQLMKKSPSFVWTEEAQVAFEELKKQLTTRPFLAAPKEKEPLLLYIAATSQVVSVAIVVEREEEGKAQKIQRPVYFISEVLTPSKQRYPHYQNLEIGIHLASQKLAHYFQDPSITVVSEAPLAEIMNNRYATGRITKWGLDLLPYDIHYQPKKAIKLQALVDFLAEWTEAQSIPQSIPEHWTVSFDGSKMLNGAEGGVVLVSPRKDEMRYVLQIHFSVTNNEVEYEALLYGLWMAISLGV